MIWLKRDDDSGAVVVRALIGVGPSVAYLLYMLRFTVVESASIILGEASFDDRCRIGGGGILVRAIACGDSESKV